MRDTLEKEKSAGQDWRDVQGKYATIRVQEGSYAAKQAPSVAREADAAIEVCRRLLEPPQTADDRVILYLSDPLAALPAAASTRLPGQRAAGMAIICLISPEQPDAGIVQALVYHLASRWFGEQAGSATLFLDGLAGIVAGRSGGGPALNDTVAWVRERLRSGQMLSILPADAAHLEGDARAAYLNAATTFVAYLLEAFGSTPVATLLRTYDATRPDQAVNGAFQRPLGALEEAWRGAMSKQASGGAFSTFFGYLLPFFRPHWKREVEIIVLMLLGLTYTLAIPLSGKYLIDTVIPSRDLGRLAAFTAALVGVYLLNMLVGVRRVYVNTLVNQQVLLALQERMFSRLQRLSHAFYGRAKVGDIMARFSSDMQVVQGALSQASGVGFYQTLVAIAASITIVTLSPLLAVLCLLVLPLFVLSFLLLGVRFGRASRLRQKLVGEVATMTQENLSAHAVVKAYGLEERMITSFRTRLGLLLKAILRLVIFAALFEISTALATTLAQIMVLGIGGYMAIKGSLSVGTLLAFIGLLPSVFGPISSLFEALEAIQGAAGSTERIAELLDEPIDVADTPDAVALPAFGGALRFDHVSFHYGGERPILQDLTATIPAGAHVAIVGPSGSGKSTVVSLLMRFYDPAQGAVMIDGQDLRAVTLASLRARIGLVFQDTFIFDTTLRENIAVGKPEATDAEVRAAAEAARLDAYIATLPNGYDTVLGERGVLMSGGQRQRLAIARAIVRDPRILILDEATSALDATTEREILATLETLSRGRTTISITHRMAVAAMADRVLVLQSGRLVQEGAPEELLQVDGLYQQLYQEQMGHALPVGGRRAMGVRVEHLRAIPLFSALGQEGLAALAGELTQERYGSGVEVVRQGEPGDTLYIIARGEVEVVVGAGGAERRVNVLGASDYFGEIALLRDEPRNATVRTLTPVQLLSLARADFQALLEDAPAVRQTLEETVAGRRAMLRELSHVPAGAVALPA